jgi:DNA-binding response OmpR family regulator
MVGTVAGARILVVEDEILVRMFAADALEDAGFRAVQAGDAAQARQLLGQGGDVQAVIVDLGLPDAPGDQFAAELRAAHPDLPILIASGRSERELKDRFSGDSRTGLLVKPYTASMLVEALASLGVSASSTP